MERIARKYSAEEEAMLQIPESVLAMREMVIQSKPFKCLLRGPVWIPLDHFDAYAWEYQTRDGNTHLMTFVNNPKEYPFDVPDLKHVERELGEVVTETGEKWYDED